MSLKQERTSIKNSTKSKSRLYYQRRRFKCTYCPKDFSRRDSYNNHYVLHNGERKYLICDHCDRGFVDKRNLVSHLKIHDVINPQERQYRCIACGAHYCEERLLKYHIRKHHFNLHAKEYNFDKKKPNETWVERVKQSEICVEITKIDDNIITIKKLSSSTNIQNVIPSKDSIEKSKFEEYISSVFAVIDKSQYSKAICDYCNKEMLKKSLQSHIRERHLKLKKFKCNKCKESFSRHYQMVNHTCGKFKTRNRKNKKS